MPSELLTVPQVAEIFATSRQSIYRWVRKGTLTALRTPGGTMRIRRSDVEAALRDGVIVPELEPTEAAS